MRLCDTDLCDEELGDSFRQFALLTGEDHFQHVAMKLLHNNKHPLWRLEHAFQVDDTWMMQILRRSRYRHETESVIEKSI